ncbi:hypothetical protein HanXRQr2_Chr02g0081931 [Helianthus annuus]|uniref:Uncharacterized protein n=1 Tax=Helianthus annuus TaxID=4232 RepID=A0A251VFH1_HELAN|nr:hypothetical protein HanXRQr2_Chr02g0081931 [Helianthus annuus]
MNSINLVRMSSTSISATITGFFCCNSLKNEPPSVQQNVVGHLKLWSIKAMMALKTSWCLCLAK